MYNPAKLFQSVIPSICLLCQQDTHPGLNFCEHCYPTLPFIRSACPVCAAVMKKSGICGKCLLKRPYFDSSLSVFQFTEPISSYIYRFKYRHEFHLGDVLSRELAKAVLSNDAVPPEIIIPVPLHRKRLRKRGFNQCAIIARNISRVVKIPFKNDYLFRHKFAVPQVELTARQRRLAVEAAFSTRHPQCYNHVALVDDVVTTAHTVNQAARALKLGGTQYISVWSLARST